MNPATNIAVMGGAGSNATAALNIEVRKKECMEILELSVKPTDTIEYKQEYAECVDLIYQKAPPSIPPFVAVLMLIIIIGSMIKGFRQEEDYMDKFFFSFVYMVVSGCVVGLLFFIIYLISQVFN